MAEKIKKVKVSDKVVTYRFGKGDYFKIVPTIYGYFGWGSVTGKNIEIEEADLKMIEIKISESLIKLNIDYLNKASRCEEIALRIKEGGLEKASKDLKEKK